MPNERARGWLPRFRARRLSAPDVAAVWSARDPAPVAVSTGVTIDGTALRRQCIRQLRATDGGVPAGAARIRLHVGGRLLGLDRLRLVVERGYWVAGAAGLRLRRSPGTSSTAAATVYYRGYWHGSNGRRDYYYNADYARHAAGRW